VIYDIRHLTIYEYGSRVTFSHCALRLLPRDGPGQKVLESSLHIDPAPKEIDERSCFFGNRVTSMTIETPHRRLTVEASSSVEVERAAPPDAASTPVWEEVRDAAYASQSLACLSPAHFLHPSRYVPRFPPAREYAQNFFAPGRPVLEAAVDLLKHMRRDFVYDPTSTVVSTPLSQAFEQRSGVCQDFAHIMIAGLRGLGLPAAYVSGYIRTIPLGGAPDLEGADAMHAWAALWCGEEAGWIGLDPTNALLVGNDHIVLAQGRDYADISPVAGIISGAGEQDIDVKVDVVPRQR
jgi:transglutaminase-like putative cysteine protease